MSVQLQSLMKQKIDIENGQICDGYNKKSLMGNWYEERWAPEQDFRKDFEKGGESRNYETDISFATKRGDLKALARVRRQPKWNTNGVIPDDGYNEFRSIHSTEYELKQLNNYKNKKINNVIKMTAKNSIYPECNQYTMNVQGIEQKKMIETNNMGRVIKDNAKREVYMNNTDFGSTFTQHPKNFNQFYEISEYQGQFAQQDPAISNNMDQIAGNAKTIRKPVNDIFEKNDTQHRPQFDNANSIAIGDGQYNHRNKYTNNAEYRHIRSDVTLIMNKPITKK